MKVLTKNIRISPRKANLVAGLVRGKKAQDALNILKFTPKKAAPILYKVVASAVANAENNQKKDIDNLFIKTVLVTKGPTYKRGMPVSRGRWHPILKRTSHISIELAEEKKPQEKPAKQAKPSKKK